MTNVSDELTRTVVEEGAPPNGPREQDSFRSDSHTYVHGEHSLGFGRTEVPPGMSFRVGVESSVNFRPMRLIIPSIVAEYFMFEDLTIGGNSQIRSPGSLPATVFSEKSFGVKMMMDTCHVNSNMIISARSISDRTRTFMAAVIGPIV